MNYAVMLKNEIFRKTFLGGKIVLTSGVSEAKNKQDIISAVKRFDYFTPDNSEHDFGKVVVHGEDYFFKIDYYDDQYQYFKEDGNRVMTIMRADEY